MIRVRGCGFAVDCALVHVRSSKTVVKEGIIEAVGDFKTVHPHFFGVCRKTRLNHMVLCSLSILLSEMLFQCPV